MAPMPTRLTPQDLDDETLLALARASDPLGVLSIYVDADPSSSDHGSPRRELDLKNRLAELERTIAEGPRKRAQALRGCLERIAGDLESLVDPRSSGRGRALFVPLSGNGATPFASQLRLPTRVVLDAAPFIHPLLELLDEGRPAGVLLASQSEAEVLEWRLGELERLSLLAIDEPHALRGPPGPISTQGGGRHSSPMREARQRRERAQRERLVDRLAAELTSLAAARGWERLLVAGGERLTPPVIEALPAQLAPAAIADPRQISGLDAASRAAAVTDRLREDHAERELRLVGEIRELALGRGAGAVGLSEVAAALNEGRVAHLVYDPEVRYQGRIGADGLLSALSELAPAEASEAEPRMTERLVERCLETGAKITPVEGASATALADAGGIAALLRW
jgi:hypothetical protein